MTKRLRKTDGGQPRKRHQGYTLPGYNYLGPGNDLHNGPPTSPSDEAARKHDEHYTDIINQGNDPYWNWNEDDQTAITNFGYDYGGIAGKTAFQLKKIAHKAGLIGKVKRRHHPFNREKKKHFLKHIGAHESSRMSGYTDKAGETSTKKKVVKAQPLPKPDDSGKKIDDTHGYQRGTPEQQREAYEKSFHEEEDRLHKEYLRLPNQKNFEAWQSFLKTYKEKDKPAEEPAAAPTETPKESNHFTIYYD